MGNLFFTIRKVLKKYFDSIRNEKFKNNILQAIPFWVASLITGVFAVLYAKAFFYAEKGAFAIFHYKGWLLFIIAPFCYVTAWWLVTKFAPYAKGSGIPQIMAAIDLATPKERNRINKLLNLRIIFIKILSSLVFVLGGGVIGREGPTIQIAGSVFRKINLSLPDWWPKISKKNMIVAGAAAGLSAAFNTPLGGVVFAVEELSKMHINYFKTALFTSVIIGGLMAQALAGPYLYLGYPNVTHLSPYIFGGVILVAVIAGLAGSGMCKIILALMNWKSKFNSIFKQILFLIIASLITVLSIYFIDERIMGSGKELMMDVLFTNEKYTHWYVPFLRIIGSILSFSAGAAGGVFAPALSSGAGIGSWVAGLFSLSASNANILILAGMVAFLTGVTRTPFTSAILVLEMTDRHNVILHLMLAGMVASIVSVIFDKHSLYDRLKHKYLHDVKQEEEVEENRILET
ncbi:MAG: chloride channel protein [Bacteroidetes bacterium]|nr:chloride channel protein [Bacteroidota bacterium]MBS1649654.1 chloride channel protein [Bacteroidota bacterium]